MSMILELVALSDANIRRVLSDPPLVWKVVAPDDPEMYESARAEQPQPSLLSKLLGRGRPSKDAPELSLSPGEGATSLQISVPGLVASLKRGVPSVATGSKARGGTREKSRL